MVLSQNMANKVFLSSAFTRNWAVVLKDILATLKYKILENKILGFFTRKIRQAKVLQLFYKILSLEKLKRAVLFKCQNCILYFFTI